MSLGQTVRTRLGRFEQPAAEAYRACFDDLDDLATRVRELAPHAARVLEIGCGDGSVADRVTATYPGCTYVGIDVAPTPGRRYTGDPARASFESTTSAQLRKRAPEPFDLVLVVDVLHHVPGDAARAQLVEDAAAMTCSAGTVLVKEWERSRHLAYMAGATADRYISGDRQALFMDRAELLRLLDVGAPSLEVGAVTSVRPWACNVLVKLGHR